MDARLIYEALFNVRGPAKEPRGEWQYVSDGQHFDETRFRQVVIDVIKTQRAYIAASRREGMLLDREDLFHAAEVLSATRRIRIADSDFQCFVELSPVGVARAWTTMPNQPLHRDASGGLTAAAVAGERRR